MADTCSNCGAELDALASETGSCPFCDAELELSVAPAGARDGDLPPDTSHLQLVESTDNRKVFHLPPGGKRGRNIGWFALAWNAIVGVITFVFAILGGRDALPAFFFLSLFWLVGATFVIVWVRMRFTRIYVLLERDRIVLQRTLFGRKSTVETLVNKQTRARLVESYQVNDESVYRIDISGTNRTAKFGTSLPAADKEWLVKTINDFIGAIEAPPQQERYCQDCGERAGATEKLCGSCGSLLEDPAFELDYQPLRPWDISSESLLNVTEPASQVLQIRFPAAPASGLRRIAVGCLSVLTLLWLGFGLSFLIFAQDARFAGVGILMAGAGPVSVLCILLSGRITITIDPDEFKVRLHLGPIGKTMKRPVMSIRGLKVTGADGDTSPTAMAAVFVLAGNDEVPCAWAELSTCREIAGLISGRLTELGAPLSEA